MKNNRVFVLALLVPLQLFLIMPITLFLNNLAELQIGFVEFSRLLLAPALAASLLILLILRIIPSRLRETGLFLLSALSILFWLQSTILLWDYGVLDGRPIDWAEHEHESYIDLLAWILLLVVAYLINKKKPGAISTVAIFIVLIQGLSAGVLFLAQKDNLPEKYEYASNATLDNIFNFSKQKNIIHIVVDGFQADVFEYLVKHERLGKRYQSEFSGFTFYREALAAFPYTRFSVPSFLANEIYNNDKTKEQFVDDVFSGVNIFSEAKRNGFELDVASGAIYFVKKYAKAKPTNLYALDVGRNKNKQLEEALEILDLAIFNAVPTPFKKLIYNEQQWFISSTLGEQKAFKHWYFVHSAFLLDLAKNIQADRDQPLYKYIHVMNTHNPMVVNSRCEYAGKVLGVTRETLTYQSKCTMDILGHLLLRLREAGVYDKSMIIIHGDHGGWIGNLRQSGEIIFSSGQKAPIFVESLASPLLAIKLPGAAQPFSISDQLVSLQQLPDTIADTFDWKDSSFGARPITTVPEGNMSVRQFRFYGWQRDAWEADYTGPIQVFNIKGSHYETDWLPEKMVFPPKNN